MSPDIAREFSQQFHSFAAELSATDLQAFLEAATVVDMPAGRNLIRGRMPIDSVYMTLSGTFEILAEVNGTVRKINEVGPGQWLGEISLLSGDSRATATVSSLTAARVLRIKHQALEEIMSQDGELVVNLLQHFALMMSGRLHDMNDKLSALAKDSRLSGALPTVSLDQDKHLNDYWPVANPASASADLKATLLTLPGIENFSPKDINILARNATVTLYPPRHVFTYQKDRCDSIFLVLDGAVLMREKMPVSDTVEEKILNVGEWFSLTSLIPNMTAFETVTAPKQVLVASITRDDFNRISEESLAVTRFFLFMLVNELARKLQSTFAKMQAASPSNAVLPVHQLDWVSL